MNNKDNKIIETESEDKKEKEELEGKKDKTNKTSVPYIVFVIIGALIVLGGFAFLGPPPSASAGGFGWEGFPAAIHSILAWFLIVLGGILLLIALVFFFINKVLKKNISQKK